MSRETWISDRYESRWRRPHLQCHEIGILQITNPQLRFLRREGQLLQPHTNCIRDGRFDAHLLQDDRVVRFAKIRCIATDDELLWFGTQTFLIYNGEGEGGEMWALCTVVCRSQVAFVEIIYLVNCVIDEVIIGWVVELGGQRFALSPLLGFEGGSFDRRDFEIAVTAKSTVVLSKRDFSPVLVGFSS